MRSVPWHVKGVAPAARETAQEAARRSGLSVGEWLNTTILGASGPSRPGALRAAAVDERARERQGRPDPGLSALNDRLDILTRQIDRLVNSAPRNGGDGIPNQLATAISRLDQRLDQLIRDGRTANSAMERRVDDVDRALASLGQERLRSAFVPARDSMEAAVAEISARQRLLDGVPAGPEAYAPPPRSRPAPPPPPPVQDLSGLEQQLRAITGQLESLNRPCRIDEAVVALRADLADIGGTLREAMPRRAVEALEGEVRKLAAQIAGGRDHGVGPAATAGLERGLAEVRDALRGLTPAENLVGFDEALQTLSRKVDLLTMSGQDPAALKQLETAVEGLRGLVAHVASGDTLSALAAEVRSLGDKFDRVAARPADDILRTLERRINAIAEAIETLRHDGSRSAVPAGFEDLIQSLTDKIERIQLSRTDHFAIGNLEERITTLVEKLDASEARLGHLGAIERGMAELLVHLEEMRSGQSATAPRAAAAPAAPAIAASPIAPVVDGLSRDVDHIKRSQTVVGRRTEDSLEAVQGTIGDVVNRLAMIESDLRTETRTPPPPSDPAGEPDERLDPAASSRTAAAESTPAASPPAQPSRSKQTPPRTAIDPSLPPDYPLEPGSGAPRARGGASAADRIAASEAPLRTARAAPVPAADTEGEPMNFLQAARRAAKAAAMQQASGDAKPDAADPDGSASKLSDRLKQLFVGFGVVVAVASTFRFAGIYLDPERVILADAPAARTELAQLPPGLPGTARAISIPDLSAGLAPAPPARSLPVIASAPAPTPAGESAFAGSPPSGAIMPDRSLHALAVASRTDVTGSLPQRSDTAAKSAPALAAAAAPATPPAPVESAALPGAGNPAVPVIPAEPPPAAGITKGLLAAATGGNAAAAHEVALRYAEGRGVAQSYKDAAHWYERAAKGGLTPAQFRLGTMYEKGLGVAKDLKEARRLYLAAADKHNAKAMHNIAVLYAEGVDGKPDYRAAAQWFRKAADYGVADSQYNLAILYARGIGVEQNLVDAYKWFALAANGGDKEAAKKRDDVAGRLDPKILTVARQGVQSWTATPQPEEATSVKMPPGGWDKAATPAEPAKAKDRGRRQVQAAIVR